MPAGMRCCKKYYNFCKINPSTGAIVWKSLIVGDGSLSNPSVFKVEPLRGTNDMLVSVQQYSSTYTSLCRVDSTGAMLWHYDYLARNFPGTRDFGSDGSNIVLRKSGSVTDQIIGLDYSGSFRWSANALDHFGNVLVSPYGAVTYNTGAGGGDTRVYNSTTGAISALLSTSFAYPSPTCINQATGVCLIPGTPATFYDSSLVSTFSRNMGAFSPDPSRWGGAGITAAKTSNAYLFDSTLATVFNVTSIAGSPINVIDCDNDASGCYFCGQHQLSSQINVFKLTTAGAFVWGACQFGIGLFSTVCNGLALSDGSYGYGGSQYLYAGGAYGKL